MATVSVVGFKFSCYLHHQEFELLSYYPSLLGPVRYCPPNDVYGCLTSYINPSIIDVAIICKVNGGILSGIYFLPNKVLVGFSSDVVLKIPRRFHESHMSL